MKKEMPKNIDTDTNIVYDSIAAYRQATLHTPAVQQN